MLQKGPLKRISGVFVLLFLLVSCATPTSGGLQPVEAVPKTNAPIPTFGPCTSEPRYHARFPPQFPIDTAYVHSDGCGAGEKLECSGPPFKLYEETFTPACVEHDYCYRHGSITYGKTRLECDEEFYEDMLSACFGALGPCDSSAKTYYEAVRGSDEAKDSYRVSDSTCCEYRRKWKGWATTATCNGRVYDPILAFGDFNGDGYADVFRGDGSTWWVSFSGTGSWEKINTSGAMASDLAFGDFNGDGVTDVFYGTGSVWRVSFSGTGSWEKLANSDTRVGDLAFGDFNGDGVTDVFYGTGSVWRVSFSGTGNWEKLANSDTRVGDLAFGDFDGDGVTDVFHGNGSIWQVSFSGTSSWEKLANSDTEPHQLAFADFDCDGKTDVFYANGSTWSISKGATESWEVINESPIRISRMGFADFNNDLTTDILYTNRTGKGYWEVYYGGTGQPEALNESWIMPWDILTTR